MLELNREGGELSGRDIIMIFSCQRSLRTSFYGAVLGLGTAVFGFAQLTPTPVLGNTGINQWASTVWPAAKAKGISRKTFDEAFAGVVANPDVLKAADHQPEFVKPVWEYLDRALTQKRIDEGVELLRVYKDTLAKLEQRFGVDRHILVAIWGLESAYGTRMGELGVIRSLATLAHQGRRKKFGFQQLIAALKILERGDVPANDFRGSWAGAMGQTQFIPTTYNAYAVDIDGDGRRNLWTSVPDALGSAANYLRASKWQKDAPTVIEVRLPKEFNFKNTGLKNTRTMAQWIELGVGGADGGRLKTGSRRAAVILPAGADGPAFMIFNNFRSILRYNNAVSYALAVSYLAKRFQGKGQIAANWPLESLPLNTAQRRELQRLLSSLGHRLGKIDGKVGTKTIKAIKAYQQAAGLKADGYPSAALLNRLRKG